MPDGSEGTIKDFLDSINSGADEVFEVSEDFKTEAKPLLTQVS